jgi:hypothetical protein
VEKKSCPSLACLNQVKPWKMSFHFWLLFDWLNDFDGVTLCLRTAVTNGPIVHLPGDTWAWRAMMMIMPAGDNSWLVHQSSVAVLPAETSGTSRRNERRTVNFAYQEAYLKCLKGSLTFHKILRIGTSSFTSHAKEGVLRILSTLKIYRRVWTRKPWVQRQAH